MCCRRVRPEMFTTKAKAEEFINREVIKKTLRYFEKEINKLRFEKNLRTKLIRYRSLCKARSQVLEHL